MTQRKKILFLCLGASLVLHVTALVLVYRHPFLLTNIHTALSRREVDLPSSSNEESKSLEEFFAKLQAPLREPPLDIVSSLPDDTHFPLIETVEPLLAALNPPTFTVSERPLPQIEPFQEAAVDAPEQLAISSPSEFPEMDISYALSSPPLSVAPDEKLVPEDIKTSLPHVASPLSETALTTLSRDFLQKESSFALSHSLANELPAFSDSTDQKNVPLFALNSPSALPSSQWSNSTQIKPLALENYELPESSSSTDWSNRFSAQIHLLPNYEGTEQHFALTLTPDKDLAELRLRKHVYFLIDRSNSIEEQRFNVFKRATLRALSSLQEGDTFNILIFDRKIQRLGESNLPFSKQTLHLAKEFLNHSGQTGNLFAATETYELLEKLIPQTLKENQLHVAILLSDGTTHLNVKNLKKVLKKWTESNAGKVTLYAATSGQGNNLTLLDLISSCNRGKLIYSRTNAALPRKLAKALLDLRSPVATHPFVQIIDSKTNAPLPLIPPSYRTFHLYGGTPYVLFGKIDSLSDLTLLIDAHRNESWVNIKKQISFKESQKAATQLSRQWAREQLKQHYENFLKEGGKQHLKAAEESLKHLGGALAFE